MPSSRPPSRCLINQVHGHRRPHPLGFSSLDTTPWFQGSIHADGRIRANKRLAETASNLTQEGPILPSRMSQIPQRHPPDPSFSHKRNSLTRRRTKTAARNHLCVTSSPMAPWPSSQARIPPQAPSPSSGTTSSATLPIAFASNPK